MPSVSDQLALTPPTAEAMARVRGELRSEWWRATLIIGAPVVVATGLGYLTVRGVLDGDWTFLLLPGIPAVVLGAVGLRLLVLSVLVTRRERSLSDAERDRAVYARGLSGTHQLAAAQEPSGFAPLSGLWRSTWAEVVAVERVKAISPRVHCAVRVRLDRRGRSGGGEERTALLIAPRAAVPSPGDRVVVLVDPHVDRAVVDLRRSSLEALQAPVPGPGGGRGGPAGRGPAGAEQAPMAEEDRDER